MKYFTLALIFTTNFSFAQVEKDIKELYSGQIGKYPIVMLLSHRPNDEQEQEYDCSYFYKNQGKIIEMNEVKFQSNVLTATAGYLGYEKFILRLLPDKSWAGTWDNKKGKPLSVSLKPLNINSINHKLGNLEEVKKWKKDDELMYVATSTLSFKQDTITYSNKIPIYWFKDSIYGTSFFRLDAKYKGINEILLKNHLDNIEDQAYSCDYDRDEGEGKGDRLFEVENFNDGLLSFYHSKGIIYCPRAPHPNWAFETGTFDLKLDKVLTFDDIFAFSEKSVIYDRNNWEEWDKYREEKVAPKIVAILRKSHPKLKETPKNYTRKDDGECYYLDNETWQYLGVWNLSKNELHLEHFDGATGYGPCSDTFNIPYSYLKSYIVPKYRPYLLK
jgi:hypothetical protein